MEQKNNEVVAKVKAKETLFPDPRLVAFGVRNNSYARSLFIGSFTPFFQLPALIWNCVLKHVFFGVWAIITFFAACFWYGVTGRVIGFELPALEVNDN